MSLTNYQYEESVEEQREQLEEILNKHPEAEFVQLQINYADWESHAIKSRECYEVARKHNKPVIVMEPLRGGKLVNNLPEDAKRLIAGNPRGWSPSDWGLRWLWDQPEVTVVLSGMNSVAMVEENVHTASDAEVGAFTEEDRAFLQKVIGIIRTKEKVGCTGCRYCMEVCPKNM